MIYLSAQTQFSTKLPICRRSAAWGMYFEIYCATKLSPLCGCMDLFIQLLICSIGQKTVAMILRLDFIFHRNARYHIRI